MKLRFPALATLPLLCSFAALASAQTDSPPPVKMGLWQSESTTTIEGAPADSPMAKAMTHGGSANVSQGCLTPETWKSDFQHMQQHQRDTDCSQTNFQQDTHHVSFDETVWRAGRLLQQHPFEMLHRRLGECARPRGR